MTSETRKLRVGVAGVGYLGRHHVRIYHELSGCCEVAGIYEVDDERAAEIADLYGCRRFGSLAEMAGACDAASVVVPTDRHAEVSLPLLEGG